ncbi:unnamed protein product [Lasius platythorax]|uniref:Tetraspanin n=1 Tax=Lasius platythorax TaxID=488582 RepID=A0AAV2NGC1_9HYME
MIAMDLTPISSLACIILIVLSGVYVFVLAVELISHFAGGALHIIPMCAFSLFGLAFFGTAGILLICYDYTQLVVQLATVILCLLAALFFLLDIAIVFVFWKRKCSACKRCCTEGAEYLLRKDEEPHPSDAKIMKHDVTTSLSDVRVPIELKSVVTPDHGYRKVEYPRRREYVDCPTCVPSLCNLSIAQIQTEPCETSVMESQTPSAVVKETPMQTFSKCEFCHQFMQTAALPVTEEAIREYSQNLSQWFYPAIVQFVRGGVGMPCCRGCKCATGTAPQPQPQPQSQRQSGPSSSSPRRKKSPAPAVPKPKTDKTSTSEATQQVTSKSDIRNCVKPLSFRARNLWHHFFRE